MNGQTPKPTLSEIRAKLRNSENLTPTESQPQNIARSNPAPAQEQPTGYPYPNNFQPGQNQNKNYGDEGLTVEREKTTFQKIAAYEPSDRVLFVHEHWHKFAAGLAFLLPLYMVFAPAGYRLPGTESFENSILRENFLFALLPSCFFAYITYRFLSKIRRTAENTKTLINIRQMSTPFKIGATLGFGYFVYTLVNPLMGAQMIEKPNLGLDAISPQNFIKLVAFTFIGGRGLEFIALKFYGEEE